MENRAFIIEECLSETVLRNIQSVTKELRNNPSVLRDQEMFFRHFIHNPPLLSQIHLVLTKKAREIFNEDLKPSFSFISLYGSEGKCPLHTDRPQCYRTIDVCINQGEIWPIYVNVKPEFQNLSTEALAEPKLATKVKETSERFDLIPGQALCYAGHSSPHWRNNITPGNFCDLVFFHFVRSDFDGPLY